MFFCGGLVWEDGDNRFLNLSENSNKQYSAVFRYKPRAANPFSRFIGKWRMKDDIFSIVWDGKNRHDIIQADHRTVCHEVNTDRSILCEVNATGTRGHLYWSYNEDTKEVTWLSNFFPARNGVGIGRFDDKGNLNFKVCFQGEPEGSHRVYNWNWQSEDEYSMLSTQYDNEGKATGNWYGSSSLRMKE